MATHFSILAWRISFMDRVWRATVHGVPKSTHIWIKSPGTQMGIKTPEVQKEKKERDSLSPLILCDPIDCSPPGSSVHGILQARILEWVAISFSKRGRAHVPQGPFLAPICPRGLQGEPRQQPPSLPPLADTPRGRAATRRRRRPSCAG